jgi:hypothetical protein
MHRAMMDTTERHGEFIAGLAAERAGLQVAQVMRVGWLATADQAWSLGDGAKMLAVAITPRRGNGEDALVDARLPWVCVGSDGFLKRSNLNSGRTVIRIDFR